MGNLGRYLRRLSSPRIRFLRKSRQSKPDPTRLFHNLLVAKLGGGPLERFAFERRKEGNAFRLNSFVRTSQTQRPRNAGWVWGEEEEEEGGKWYFSRRSFDPPRHGGKNDRGRISDSSSIGGRLEMLGARRKSTRMRRQTREQLADYRYRWWINGCFSSAAGGWSVIKRQTSLLLDRENFSLGEESYMNVFASFDNASILLSYQAA